MVSSASLEAPVFEVLTVEEAARALRIGRSLAYQLARSYEASSGTTGLPVIRLGCLLRVPRWALLELMATGRVVRLCNAAVPVEALGDA